MRANSRPIPDDAPVIRASSLVLCAMIFLDGAGRGGAKGGRANGVSTLVDHLSTASKVPLSTAVDKGRVYSDPCVMPAQDTSSKRDAPAPNTQARLKSVAQTLFWSRGYSNVSLRDIARGAGVDVALIGRYFGSKEGLFDQTLYGAFDVIPDPSTMQRIGRDGLIDYVIDLFTRDAADGQDEAPSVVDLVAMNGHDPDIGGKVMAQQQRHIHAPLTAILGSAARAELFWAVIIGCCITQNAKPQKTAGFSAQNATQLRHMLQAAANFGQADT